MGLNVYQKLAAIYGEVQYLAKDDKVEFGATKYKALSEEKVTTIMREKMVKYGLIVYPVEMSASRSGQISHVDVKYRIQNVEAPDEFIEVVSCGDGADSQDKGAGKAMTYAFKYMWLRTFAIPTGEDPDKISSAELDAKQAEEEKATICSDCGKPIKAVKTKYGEVFTAESIVDHTTGMYGKPLCFPCAQEAKKRGEFAALKAERAK